jgi:hypothetical protein
VGSLRGSFGGVSAPSKCPGKEREVPASLFGVFRAVKLQLEAQLLEDVSYYKATSCAVGYYLVEIL